MTSHQLQSVEAICLFAFAGDATLTLRSAKTEARFTYKIEAAEGGKVTHFVSLLNGPDNEGSYAYLGHFFGPDYVHGRKSIYKPDAPSAKAFAFFAKCLAAGKLHEALEVYHEGRCGACGRKLTVPESILTGLGPDCSERMGVARIKCDDPGQLELAVAA
jgi:uncharacterized protein DUF6011